MAAIRLHYITVVIDQLGNNRNNQSELVIQSFASVSPDVPHMVGVNPLQRLDKCGLPHAHPVRCISLDDGVDTSRKVLFQRLHF